MSGGVHPLPGRGEEWRSLFPAASGAIRTGRIATAPRPGLPALARGLLSRACLVYEQICSWENLLLAYRRASKGKRGQVSVAAFEHQLEENLLRLQDELRARASCVRGVSLPGLRCLPAPPSTQAKKGAPFLPPASSPSGGAASRCAIIRGGESQRAGLGEPRSVWEHGWPAQGAAPEGGLRLGSPLAPRPHR